jgi:uncharacterized protein YceH (UPF0502 family)
LLLRGPQTPGELRSRVPRFAALPDPGVVEALLDGLVRRADGPLVAQLAREPGRRDSRWVQLFEELPASLTVATGDEPASSDTVSAPPAMPPRSALIARIATLESEVAALRTEIAVLNQERPG